MKARAMATPELVLVPTGRAGVEVQLQVLFRLGPWAVTTVLQRLDEAGLVMNEWELDTIDTTPALTYLGPGAHHGAKACHGASARVLRTFIEQHLRHDATVQDCAAAMGQVPYALAPDKTRHLWVGRAAPGWQVLSKTRKPKNMAAVPQ